MTTASTPFRRERLLAAPTPLSRLDLTEGAEGAELWLKDDGATHSRYGGNKVRKLEYLIGAALDRGARRIITAGAAGSHHVLATTLFARERGIDVAALLAPQPWSEHAEDVLRACLAAGAELLPLPIPALLPLELARLRRPDDYLVPIGGSNVVGALGYASAVSEIVDAVRDGAPEPDLIVAPLGSGGTVAGLLAGVARQGLRARVLGVSVALPGPAAQALTLWLAARLTRAIGGSAGPLRLAQRLSVDDEERGAGYGAVTTAGSRAAAVASSLGLALDPTYTAKAFAACLKLLGDPAALRRSAGPAPDGARRAVRLLYWHTLSSVPAASLSHGSGRIPEKFARLLTRG